MDDKLKSVVAILFVFFLFTGCYMNPVRHLASDVALVTVGTSTKDDVLVYLGDPDDKVTQQDGVEKWLYEDEKKTILEKTPYLGKYAGSPEVNRVVVSFKNNIVIECTYTSSDEDDLDWKDDYSWQEKKK